MKFSATYLGSSGWVIDLGDFRILIDPWIKGKLSFPPGPWLIEGTLKKEIGVPEGVNLILLTQGLADHSHKPSLATLPKSIPVVGSSSAIKVAKGLGFLEVYELQAGEKRNFLNLQIEATSGALVPNPENGYLLSHSCGTLYIEPHGFLDGNISPRKIDAVITPVVNLKLPLVGSFIKGKQVLPELIKVFQPLTLLSSTTGGDAVFSGLINNLITMEGNSNEVAKYLSNKTLFIEPTVGALYELDTYLKE